MPANKPKSVLSNPGIVLVSSYIALFFVNAVVIWLAHGFFPDHIVLGTISLTALWAVILTSGKLSLLNTFAIPFIREYEIRRKKMFSPTDWMIFYFFLNFGGVWLITRFPNQFGTGIKTWFVAVVLAVVLDIFQGVVMMQIEKLRPKN